MLPITTNSTCCFNTRKNKQKFINTKNTGILATVALSATSIRAFSNAKVIKKTHKPLALIALASTILHIATASYHRYLYKSKK